MVKLKRIYFKIILMITIGLPILLAIICGNIFKKYYVQNNNCSPYGPLKLSTVTIPGGIILVFNLIVFILVLRNIHSSQKMHTYILQYVLPLGTSEVAQLIFILFNATHGIFLFIVFVAANKLMRKHITSTLGIRSITSDRSKVEKSFITLKNRPKIRPIAQNSTDHAMP